MIEKFAFDSFEPYNGIKKQPFAFCPNRYEIWMKGELIDSGKTKNEIVAEVKLANKTEIVEVTFSDSTLYKEMSNLNEFDAFISLSDRLMLCIVPLETNVWNGGITSLLNTIGHTRKEKNFKSNEPYCCNIFTIKGCVAKLTFSFSNPEKLLEFYY
jgi:hypothetical protein